MIALAPGSNPLDDDNFLSNAICLRFNNCYHVLESSSVLDIEYLLKLTALALYRLYRKDVQKALGTISSINSRVEFGTLQPEDKMPFSFN